LENFQRPPQQNLSQHGHPGDFHRHYDDEDHNEGISMHFNASVYGRSTRSAKVHRTPLVEKILWAVCVAFFAVVACFASGSLITAAFVVAFAAISWHYIVRDETAMHFTIFNVARDCALVRSASWDFSETDNSVGDLHTPRYEFRPSGYDCGGDDHGDYDFTGVWKQRHW